MDNSAIGVSGLVKTFGSCRARSWLAFGRRDIAS
jgi:hypothetical protein